MSASAAPNPLIEAKPPATDHITYLTIIEYNLTEENLPTLHEVLQDADLTTNIGWDLVHLLIPLLPASQECLQDIARLGNPREVVLKATEALRMLEFEHSKEIEDEHEYEGVAVARAEQKPSVGQGGASDGGGDPNTEARANLQFQALVSMLAVLHPRIKTKHPSRFLSTSLQAVLVAYERGERHAEHLTESVIAFVKALSGTKRPQLPSRTSSSHMMALTKLHSGPDPEGNDAATSEDTVLQRRLLQSFITHILEDYLLSLTSSDDIPGLAWCSRLQEKMHPDRFPPDIPGKITFASRFASEEILIDRSSTMGQIAAIADDLEFHPAQLLDTILDKSVEATGHPAHEDEPPGSAEDVPLSKTGSLFLYAASAASKTLYGSKSVTSPLSIFPDHATLLENFLGKASRGSTGMEPEALIDALLFLGLVSLEANSIGEPTDDEHFMRYLQNTSLLSANCPSPSLRYHAHYLTTTVLRSHPSDLVRLTLIRDTLEHCPFENLKASAIGWLKGETIEANLVPHSHNHSHSGVEGHEDSSTAKDEEHSIFATPVALSTLAPHLFPDLSLDVGASVPLEDAWMTFKRNMTLYLTTLNFYYFLLKATPLHMPLEIASLHETSDIGGSYLGPLKVAIGRFDGQLQNGELAVQEGGDAEAVRAELGICQEVTECIETEVKKLNRETAVS